MRTTLIQTLKNLLPENTPVVALFDKANILYTSAIHTVTIVQYISKNLIELPDPLAYKIAEQIGIPQNQFTLLKAKHETVKHTRIITPSITLTMNIHSTMPIAISIIETVFCNIDTQKKIATFSSKPKDTSIVSIACANIISADLHPAYTYFYTAISSIIMHVKHLFISFCYLLEQITTVPNYEMIMQKLNIPRRSIPSLRKNWLIDRIFQKTEIPGGIIIDTEVPHGNIEPSLPLKKKTTTT